MRLKAMGLPFRRMRLGFISAALTCDYLRMTAHWRVQPSDYGAPWVWWGVVGAGECFAFVRTIATTRLLGWGCRELQSQTSRNYE